MVERSNIIPPERWLAILIDAGEYDLAKEVRQEIYQKVSAQKDTDQKGNEKQGTAQ